MIISKYMDIDVEYDPEKHHFFCVVNGKKLHHKKQIKLETLIKKALEPPKRMGRPPKSGQIEKPKKQERIKTDKAKRKYTRHVKQNKRGVSSEPDESTSSVDTPGMPADLIKDIDDVDIAASILKNKLDRVAAAKGGHKLEAAILIARESIKTVINAVKLILNHNNSAAG